MEESVLVWNFMLSEMHLPITNRTYTVQEVYYKFLDAKYIILIFFSSPSELSITMVHFLRPYRCSDSQVSLNK